VRLRLLARQKAAGASPPGRRLRQCASNSQSLKRGLTLDTRSGLVRIRATRASRPTRGAPTPREGRRANFGGSLKETIGADSSGSESHRAWHRSCRRSPLRLAGADQVSRCSAASLKGTPHMRVLTRVSWLSGSARGDLLDEHLAGRRRWTDQPRWRRGPPPGHHTPNETAVLMINKRRDIAFWSPQGEHSVSLLIATP